MTRQPVSSTFLMLGLAAAVAVAAPPDRLPPAADPDPGSVAILQALRANPVTAPYRFGVSHQGRQYAVSGRVGTKMVHDVAIRSLIALGYPVRDDLTIDTGEVNRLANQSLAQYRYGGGAGSYATPALGSGNLAYVYPPPLFGRLDDPFFGLEPPLVSYAPWFGGASARREPMNVAALNGPGQGQGGVVPLQTPAPTVVSSPAGATPAAPATPVAGANGALTNPIEMTLDSQGIATLRGQVPTLADRVAVGQELARTPGIAQVVNLLEVGGNARAVVSEVPPPPPTPAFRPVAPEGAAPPAGQAEKGRSIPIDGDPLARNVADSIARRPALAAVPVKVSSRDGVVTLSGRLPSSYEAMLAFRAAQQTPGVHEVIDRQEFPIPDTDRPNPLREKGRPEDVEAYLLAQVRRQVGDLAHVDLVRVRGDALEIRGTVTRNDDTPRVEAALRSIPLLRGYRLEPSFPTD